LYIKKIKPKCPELKFWVFYEGVKFCFLHLESRKLRKVFGAKREKVREFE